jgi:peptidoglycan/LPS O-acetylase OafA/YrhL
MYILLALIATCALGIGVHYLLPHRSLRGVALVPAIATAASAVIYTIMQWAGVSEGNGWLWLASIVGALLIAAVAGLLLTQKRLASDAAKKAALGI